MTHQLFSPNQNGIEGFIVRQILARADLLQP